MGKDWVDWHRPYDEPGSPLRRRLEEVRRRIGAWLDEQGGEPVVVVSMCAGQGRDLLDVLAGRADAGRVRATLIEFDPRNVAVARESAEAAKLDQVSVVEGDAGELASYLDAVPADLVLMAGVLGNITDADVRATIEALPQFCAQGATVIWTRTREAPDLTPAIRRWLAEAGFAEQAFVAPDDVLFSVGVHRFTGTPRALSPAGKIFQFVN